MGDFEIGDLKLLIAAETDCIDDNGNPLEIKFGRNDQEVSTWSQCFLSGVSTVVQARRTMQENCALILELEKKDAQGYFDSDDHRNTQMMVFYNVMKQIQSSLKAKVTTDGQDGEFP